MSRKRRSNYRIYGVLDTASHKLLAAIEATGTADARQRFNLVAHMLEVAPGQVIQLTPLDYQPNGVPHFLQGFFEGHFTKAPARPAPTPQGTAH